MMFFIGAIIGAIVGFMTMALMAASGNSSRCEECVYRKIAKEKHDV